MSSTGSLACVGRVAPGKHCFVCNSNMHAAVCDGVEALALLCRMIGPKSSARNGQLPCGTDRSIAKSSMHVGCDQHHCASSTLPVFLAQASCRRSRRPWLVGTSATRPRRRRTTGVRQMCAALCPGTVWTTSIRCPWKVRPLGPLIATPALHRKADISLDMKRRPAFYPGPTS